ncbi:MAG: copper resistance protein [Gaiellaceae bacterium]|jgi:methionine-rich copper-binding protein CopC|nr:copper resistance protein [Gaiellaceae bacterium]
MISLRALRVIPVLAAVLALGVATTVPAHTEVRSTSPASGTTVKTSITRVTVTFSAPLRRGTLRVVGAGGKVVSAGGGGRDPRNTSRLLVGLKGGLKPGSYRAKWTAVAADGHRQNGAFGFRLRA